MVKVAFKRKLKQQEIMVQISVKYRMCKESKANKSAEVPNLKAFGLFVDSRRHLPE